jgi:hypothetical protein
MDAADGMDAGAYSWRVWKKGVPLSNAHPRTGGNYVDAAAIALEETGDVDRAAMESRLRENLALKGWLRNASAELARIMDVLTAF